ncbi:hypothetical protein GDO81_000900 [Engystomops pustulosus]|uniref:Uncharacterized protein n=1 Tax=Engystomops pustulosus TaxID=76066 RepID=A0AAV7D825_ENGPU|nr:hypothetical protein GDO81_000900 [Engystomops pustulosus]
MYTTKMHIYCSVSRGKTGGDNGDLHMLDSDSQLFIQGIILQPCFQTKGCLFCSPIQSNGCYVGITISISRSQAWPSYISCFYR